MAAVRISAGTTMTDDPRFAAHPALVSGAGRGGALRRVGADPEPGDARRQTCATRRRPRTRRRRCSSTGRGWSSPGPGGGSSRDRARRLLRPVGRHDARARRAGDGDRAAHCRHGRVGLGVPATDAPPRPRPRVGDAGVRSRRARRDAARVRQPRAAAVVFVSERRRERAARGMFAGAAPSPTSMRASPEYRLAMLRVLAARAIATARQRLRRGVMTRSR